MVNPTARVCVLAIAFACLSMAAGAQSSDSARAVRARADSVRLARLARAQATQPRTDSLHAGQPAGAKAPSYEGVRAPTYGGAQAPSYGGTQPPTYGGVKAPTYGGVKAPTYGSVKARQYKDVSAAGQADSTQKASRPNAGASQSQLPATSGGASAATPTPSGWTARYYYVDAQGLLHTWDFVADGTYLYREVFNGGGASHGTSERGTYAVSGDVLEVHVTRVTTASGSVVNGVTTMASGETGPGQTRRYSFRMLGEKGKDGIVMNGITLKPKSW